MPVPSRAARPEELVGTVIDGRFELLAFAGAGGMGHVYRARDRASGEAVAVKLLAPDNAEVARFEREAAVLASITHPGVVRYLAHGEADDGARYLAMQWLEGADLADRLGEGTLDVQDTLVVAAGVADALAAAHARGVVHRDLKPANLFLVGGRFDSVKLLDFGIARAPMTAEITATGALVGTPAYMAPEQVRGGAMDARVDVYACGAVVFRCLTGAPPFGGPNQLAVLAKILLEEPPPLRASCPHAPRELEALVARLLSKDPGQRPADGAALAAELRGLGDAGSAVSVRVPAAVGAHEQRVASMVLCARGDASDEVTAPALGVSPATERMQQAIAVRGGVIDPLARGAWIVTIPSALSPAEEATRASRCALALAEVRSGAPVVVVTGRVLVSGVRRVGEVIDRAAEALVRAGAGVQIDSATADLLDARFQVEGAGAWRRLLGEDASASPVRTLLGRPAPCVGRESQLAALTATLASCEGEARVCAALVSAPPGLGKTRLVHEWLRAGVLARPDAAVLTAQGDPLRAGSPLGVAAQMIQRASGIVDSDDAATRGAKIAARMQLDGAPDPVREILCEIAGAPVSRGEASPALLAARADLTVMADAVREAWIGWLDAVARGKAVAVLVVEDVHWADAASVRLLQAAESALEDRPLLILATGRPEARGPFGDAFRERGLVELTLGPLSPAAAQRLVRGALGPGVDDGVARTLVRRAAGHPFHLEELVRAVAGGAGADALPDSVLGMVQVRLDGLSGVPRRLLRAASVFGERFHAAGVATLLGDDVSDAELRAALSYLTRQELVSAEAGPPAPRLAEYRFRHSIVRDAAYATLADADAMRAHRRAGQWLESVGEGDPAVLAEHYVRGGAPELAIPFFHAAASQALRRHDFERAASHAARAMSLGPDPRTRAGLRAVEAEILYWQGDLGAAADRASAAAAELTRGGPAWFEAVSVAAGALGQLGQNDAVARWLDETTRLESPPESRAAHVVALCRGLTQLVWAHHRGDLARPRACLDELVARSADLGPFELGWVHRARGESAWVIDADVGRCLRELDASRASFEAAHALRALSLTRINAASLTGWAGDVEGAIELLRAATADAERLGQGFLARYGAAVRSLLLTYARDPGAEESTRRSLAGVSGSPRLACIARVCLGALALARGDLEMAGEEARAASALPVVDDLRSSALALSARLATARGRLDEAERLATEANQIEASCSDLELSRGMAGLALADVRRTRGDADGARAALAPVLARLSAIAGTLGSSAERERFWRRPLPNEEILGLAERLGLERPADGDARGGLADGDARSSHTRP